MTSESQAALFPEVPGDRAARIDAEIMGLLSGRSGGPLGLCLEDNEKILLRELRFRRGAARALPIREIVEKTGIGVRTVKDTIRCLRMNFRLPIGSSKHSEHGGYYLMITSNDYEIWRGDVLDQVRAELAVLRAAAGEQAVLELVGQLRAEAGAAA